jgi:hypothetical protein
MSRAIVTVNPTSTSMAVVDVRDWSTLAIGVKNLDETQTLSVWIRRRADALDDFTNAQQPPEFVDIQPLEQACVDVNVGSQVQLEVVGVASGAGLSAVLTIRASLGRYT